MKSDKVPFLTLLALILCMTIFSICTFLPVKFTVVFESNGGSAVESLVNLEKGSQIAVSVEPQREYYIFMGWYKDAELSTAWDFSIDTVIDDITLYAKWVRINPRPYSSV